MLFLKKMLIKIPDDIIEKIYSEFDECKICKKKIIGYYKICSICSKI